MRESYLLLYIVMFVGTWTVVTGLLLLDFGLNQGLLQIALAVVMGYGAASMVVTLLFALFAAAGEREPAARRPRRSPAAR